MFEIDKLSIYQNANICWIIEKAKEFQKNICFCFIDYAKVFVWITTNWKMFKQMGIPGHFICPQRYLYAYQEETDRTGLGTTKLGQYTSRLYIATVLTKLLWIIYHVKCQAGWLTSWNQDCQEKYKHPQISRYHSFGRKQKWTKKSLDKGKRGESKSWLKTQIQTTKIMASCPITSCK